jgi:hypothetical protein
MSEQYTAKAVAKGTGYGWQCTCGHSDGLQGENGAYVTVEDVWQSIPRHLYYYHGIGVEPPKIEWEKQ